MTTITFERTGGVVGNALHLDLDLNSLPADEAQYLQQLITQCDFHNIPENSSAEITPDEFHYAITVKAGNSNHTVHTTDTAMPKSLLPLIKELTMLKVTQ